MSARPLVAALAALAVTAACATVGTEMPERWSTATPLAESNPADAGMRGLRITLEGPLAKGWTGHVGAQALSTSDAEFGSPGAEPWDEVTETAIGARRWWTTGPLLASLGAEFGFGFGGNRLADDDEPYYALAALGSLRWDLPAGDVGALSFEADLHYRAPLALSADALGSGDPARDVFGGWVLFVGVGWAW